MFTRRDILRTTGVAVVGATAGCSQIPFVGDDPIEFEASRATVPDATLSETGYEEHEVTTQETERTFRADDETQDVVVTNWLAQYDRAVDLSEIGLQDGERYQAAVFTVLSTPQVLVLDRSFNPVGDMGSAELAEMVQDRYEGIDNVEQVGEDGALVAGRETRAGEFRADAELVENGTSVDLAMHITEAVEVGDDFVVTVGGYPSEVQATEKDFVFQMMEAVSHDG